MKKNILRASFGVVILAGVALGCGDKVMQAPPPPAQRQADLPSAAATSTPAAAQAEYSENDFVENDRNRDPFRSYARSFVDTGRKPTLNQRAVVLPQYSVDELKLVAIVTGGDYPRAMLVDPAGKGWVVKRGDFLGRPDVVHTGGSNGTDYQLNWRVDRVRDGDLVLLREDPAQPGIPPATRVIPIRPESENREQKLEN
jgi:type IV pilus assembly protein PilP